jgi:CDP-diacylglycerol--glycerol-3-phosphate 3-phosphatidyltransferase/cardiolipin synthase
MHHRSLTAADIVSLTRLALAGMFVATRSPALRLTVVAIAALSDWIDGWLARRRGASDYGAVIDPAADRVFVVVVLVTLVVEETLSAAECLVLLGRDIATTVGVVIVRAVPALRSTRLEARFSGKVVTTLQFLVVVAAIAAPAMLEWLLPAVAVATVISIADYAGAVWRSRAPA